MFANKSLKFKLIGAFCIVAAILGVVGWTGWSGVRGGGAHLDRMTEVEYPAYQGLALMMEGMYASRASYNELLNPALTPERRQAYTNDQKMAWETINEGRKLYETIPQSAEEAAVWRDCVAKLDLWEKHYLGLNAVIQDYLHARDAKEMDRLWQNAAEIVNTTNWSEAEDDLGKKLEEIAELGVKHVQVEVRDGDVFQTRSAAMSLYTSIGGILTALAFGIFLSLSISRRMNSLATAVADGASNIAAAATQVASSAQSVASGSQEQAASIEETSSSLEELAAMTKQNADNTKTVAALMNEAKTVVNRAAKGTESMDSAMKEIKSASDQTSKIIKTIDEIAFQTNLLALNAAVEAARAGEAGKGFAVVAEEVRNLAMRAAEAAKNTGSLIEENVNRVAGGVQIVESLKTALTDVTTSSGKVAGLVNEIAAASDEQSKGIEQINVAVTQMNQVTQGNAANAEESASASEEMSGQAESMNDLVNQMIVVINGQSHADPMTHRAHTANKAVTSVHKMTAKLAAKPVLRPVGKKLTAPEKVIPLDDHEELGRF